MVADFDSLFSNRSYGTGVEKKGSNRLLNETKKYLCSDCYI